MRNRSLLAHICAPAPVALAVAFALSACGAPMTPIERAADQGLSADNGLSPNGLTMNGLAMNGLSMNGLSMNGLSMNGLSMNGLSTTTFSDWFRQSPPLADSAMRYVVRCAVANGQALSWTDASTGVTYTWNGFFGLAPTWSSGQQPTVPEQQLVSACLAAHVNKYGIHVPISVQGKNSKGVVIPLAPNENTDYSVKEACFFGNLFSGDGIFSVVDHPSWDNRTSSARACALEFSNGFSADCPPIDVLPNECSSYCKQERGKSYYSSCTYGGKTYLPITTRLLPAEKYKCGDGVCQFTESCGSGDQWNNCKADCGPCP